MAAGLVYAHRKARCGADGQSACSAPYKSASKPKYTSASGNFHRILNEAAPYRGCDLGRPPRTKVSRVDEVPVISIVDDDASVRTATARLLRSLGFSAHAFASAQEFLSSPRMIDTSCLIADVQMPGMSGVELQEHLTAHGHSTPIIFITAFPEQQIRERAMNGGAIGFLSKPFDESRLLECVERALARRQNRPDKT
jgi:CheY-like chemotaxis protein